MTKTSTMTHEAISTALCENAPLSDDQRAALLSLIARDKQEQAERDTLVDRLKAEAKELKAFLRSRDAGIVEQNRQLNHFRVLCAGQADELERLRAQVAPAEALLNAATLDWPSSPATRRKVLEAADTLRRSLVATAAGNVATPEQTSGSSAAAPVAGQSLTVGERADGLTEEQIVTFLDAFQNDRKLLGDYEAFAGTARDIWAAALAPAAQAEPVAWRYRHILNTLNPAVPEAITEWRPVEPRDCLQTLEQRIAELRAYRYDGRPCYEVQALYAAPSNPPAQGVELPPLPEPDVFCVDGSDRWGYDTYSHAYSADALQAYARAAIAQAPAAKTATEGGE